MIAINTVSLLKCLKPLELEHYKFHPINGKTSLETSHTSNTPGPN